MSDTTVHFLQSYFFLFTKLGVIVLMVVLVMLVMLHSLQGSKAILQFCGS